MREDFDIYKACESEAKGLLDIWVNAANNCGLNGDGSFDEEPINRLLDSLEAMLLVYNAFSKVPLEIVEDEDTGLYSLVVL